MDCEATTTCSSPSLTCQSAARSREKEQGDGIPAGQDANKPAEPVADTQVDPPIDPVAQIFEENQALRAELDAARQSFRSERAAREEVQDVLHQMRADITRLLSVSEKALWEIDATATTAAREACRGAGTRSGR